MSFLFAPRTINIALDNRISGVGYENTLITSELYETYNERKFIPVLFAGTWETSLPIWAKGKLGIDLSSQESYEANYRDLISYLQNYVLNESIESTVKHGEEQTIPENHLDISNVKSKITKIRGLVLFAVISGIILWVILSYGSLLLSNFKNPIPNDSSIDNTTSNNIGIDDIEPNNTSPDDTALDDTTLYDIFPDDTYLNLIKSTSNGTMPKGTTPIIITITEETKEKLAFTQELFIGCSKKWIDDTLGPPFAERRLSTTDDILISPYEDESNKTGEIFTMCIQHF